MRDNYEVYNEYTGHQDATSNLIMQFIFSSERTSSGIVQVNVDSACQGEMTTARRQMVAAYETKRPYTNGLELLRRPCQLFLGSPPCCAVQVGSLVGILPASLSRPTLYACTFFPMSQKPAVSDGFVSLSPNLPINVLSELGPEVLQRKPEPQTDLYLMARK